MIQQQNFPFPSTIINRILESDNMNVAQNLSKSCKYLRRRNNKYSLVHILKNGSLFYDGREYTISYDDVDLFGNNIWLSGEFSSYYLHNFMGPRLFTWISKVSRCTIKFLQMCSLHTLTFKGFQILTKSGTVESIEINKVFYEDETLVPLEVIMSYIPNATNICIESTHVTPSTMAILITLKRDSQLTQFNLKDVDGELNDEHYFQFMNKYAAPQAMFAVGFCDVPKKEVKQFAASVKMRNLFYKHPFAKPEFSIIL